MKIHTHITHFLSECTEEEAEEFVRYEAQFMGTLDRVNADTWQGEATVPGYNGLGVERVTRVRLHHPTEGVRAVTPQGPTP